MRAYCTQNDRPIETTSTANADSSRLWAFSMAWATPSRRSAMRIAGNVSCTSAIRMMIESVQPPAYPEISPSPTPIAAAEGDAAKADRERDAQPIEDRGEHIASLVVRSEQELRVSAGDEARRIERVGEEIGRRIERVGRRDPRREQRRQQKDDRHCPGGDRDLRRQEAREKIAVLEARNQGPVRSDAPSGSAAISLISNRRAMQLDAQPRVHGHVDEIDDEIDDHEQRGDEQEIGGHDRNVGVLN